MKKADLDNKKQEAIWCVYANIRTKIPFGEGGELNRIGDKLFRGGTKVYIIDWYPGMCENIIVIGMHRKTRKYINATISVKHVENLRVKLTYEPKIIEIIKYHFSPSPIISKEKAENMCQVIPGWWSI